jgi:D-alanine-D-alanine ligase
MKNIVLLFGGNSSEHLISCLSAKSIYENVDLKKFNVTLVGVDFNNDWYIFDDNLSYLRDGNWQSAIGKEKIHNIIAFLNRFDAVFPIIHGKNGEDGKLQGFLEMFNIPYVGCNLIASAIGMDKAFAKIIFSELGIPQIPYKVIKNKKEINFSFDYPVIVKPSNGGSSIGITKVSSKKEIKKAIENAFKYDNKVIIEKFITAKELECAVLHDGKFIASTVGEIIPANDFYDYDAKYNNSSSKTIIPANIDKNLQDEIKAFSEQAFLGMDGYGFARVDYLYDLDNKKLYLNEINTIPGFTSISMYPKLFEYDGIEYKKLITKLINSAIKKR